MKEQKSSPVRSVIAHIVLIYLFLSKYIIAGVTLGGVKE